MMGSVVLKRASSSYSSSGFGSGGSEHSEEPHCAPAASGWYPAQSELRQSTV
ncbi:hypothetical protein DPMN_084070 [Dreissena polymorpha]|uniref:Uncharacterized protein n=1 Tax=Dreissena polymorpha TaxID=45954 RepID=A0A9D4BJ18_DREPO|nr:hypothetical protein DPMN_084070 [Dreissena polymorpha]